ncbi:MAG: hypothetical protein O7B99_12615 [Planctomycetota bacterium]|nr:hypothetical protein [Planctomycetota bacterium]
MTRRYLTAGDVRRSQESEIVVDESTVVTPQAQAAAEARGVAIRTASGDWSEPVPDRGPDTSGGTHTPPHLPEPPAEPGVGTGAVITAIGKNRPGVLAELTHHIAELGADVRDVSQKTIESWFHLVLVVELPATLDFSALKTHLESLGSPEDYVVRVMHERVFRFMHRV